MKPSMKTVNIGEIVDIFATLDEILKISTDPVRCEVYLGGKQPVPIRCGLNVHTGQHAGIDDNEETVIWPEISTQVTCPACDGTGVVYYSPSWLRSCETCGATGRVRR